ncbi:MAG TPA: DUF2269 family protein [Gaiellaceae bacterium]|nr:DUF2269 family protein [Gaiellaceae bacterium]
MSWYELWLFLHIAGTILWAGGAVVVQAFGILTQRAADPAQSAAFGRNTAWVGTRIFMPSSAVVLVTGALLTEDGNWDWAEPFIVLGLLGWLIVAGAGFAYITPQMGRLSRRMAAEGPSPELLGRVKRLVLLARVLVLVLFVIVFMMVVKLGT